VADQREIVLRQGDATPKDIILREMPAAAAATPTTVWMFEGDSTPKDIILRNPLETPTTGGAASIVGAGGIASAEAFGSPALSVLVSATGIASAEAFGQPTVTAVAGAASIMDAGGIASAEAFGAPSLFASIQAAGISSGEAFGQPTVTTSTAAADILSAGGIASGEGFGLPTISWETASAAYGWPAYRRRKSKRQAQEDVESAALAVQEDAYATQAEKARADGVARAARAAQGFRELRLLDDRVRWLLRRATEARVRDDEDVIVTWLLLH